MQELQHQPHEQTSLGGSTGLDSIFAAAGDNAPSVLVGAGVHHHRLPVAGMSVGEIRARYADRFDIGPQAQAMVDGRVVGDDCRLRSGQSLHFTHKAGEKGV
jgi:hypothetical protein